MGLLERLFRKNRIKSGNEDDISGRCVELVEWEEYIKKLNQSNHYVSRKEYAADIEKFADVMKLFISMDENDTLDFYCNKHGFDANRARETYLSYQTIDDLVRQANDKYIS
ncbi:MAG: hypothetical protein K2N24_01765 [Lachnospiraceae bacterium]|nr:hypothetical protein [Lachnospiraceae bacterium]